MRRRGCRVRHDLLLIYAHVRGPPPARRGPCRVLARRRSPGPTPGREWLPDAGRANGRPLDQEAFALKPYPHLAKQMPERAGGPESCARLGGAVPLDRLQMRLSLVLIPTYNAANADASRKIIRFRN